MIYKIRIILDTLEDVFRDIEIKETDTLEDFHNAINQSFGFEGLEMAAFYESDEEWTQGNEYLLFDMGDEAEVPLMHQVNLKDVLDKDHTKMIYVYDFFNMWTFYIELADIIQADETQTYPNLLFVHGQLPDSPPEKQFEAETQPKKKEAWEEMLDFDDELNDGNDFENLDDFDFDENWN
jgi:hypothetical protein